MAKHSLKWYTVIKLFDRELICVQGVSCVNALARALVLLDIPYSERFNYRAEVVNYNVTRDCKIV